MNKFEWGKRACEFSFNFEGRHIPFIPCLTLLKEGGPYKHALLRHYETPPTSHRRLSAGRCSPTCVHEHCPRRRSRSTPPSVRPPQPTHHLQLPVHSGRRQDVFRVEVSGRLQPHVRGGGGPRGEGRLHGQGLQARLRGRWVKGQPFRPRVHPQQGGGRRRPDVPQPQREQHPGPQSAREGGRLAQPHWGVWATTGNLDFIAICIFPQSRHLQILTCCH